MHHLLHSAHFIGHCIRWWITWEQPYCSGIGWHPCSEYYGHPAINEGNP